MNNQFIYTVLLSTLLSLTLINSYSLEPPVNSERVAKITDGPGGTLSSKESDADCGCTWTFDPAKGDTSINIKGADAQKIKPGDVICLKAGKYHHISFENLTGAPGNPIIIKNCGGQAVISSDFHYMFRVANSKYVKVTGTGDPGYFYGIKAGGPLAGASYSFGDIISDIQIDHIEGNGSSTWGLQLKTNPKNYDSLTWHPYGVINNIVIHDTKMSNVEVEGYYIGYTNYNIAVKAKDAGGKDVNIEVDAPAINGLKFYNNISDHTGWDGIQIAAAENIDVHDNYVKDYGYAKVGGQMDGMIFGARSWGKMYSNFIDGGASTGLHFFGYNEGHPPSLVYNNLIINAGWDGIACVDRPNEQKGGIYAGQKYYIFNNTIVNAARNGIALLDAFGAISDGLRVNNNLIVHSAATNISVTPSLRSKTDTTNNSLFATVAEANFQSGTWKLAPASPAYNKTGANLSAYFSDDYEHVDRGGVYGMGAYKTFGSVTATPPSLTVPPDQTISITTITLSGSATPASGATISTYHWTKKSGPTSYSIANPNSATAAISSLVSGVYEFEFTVVDDKGGSASAVVKVTVSLPNKAPLANAGSDITITLPTNTVSLKGSGTDSDGNIVSYLWVKKSGPSSFNVVNNKSAVTDVSGLVQGSYEFELTVTDDKGATATDVVKVTVNGAANKAPVANAGTDITITLPTNTVSLKGSGTDSDGNIVSYLWVKKSGPSSFTIVNNKSAVTDVSGLVQGSYEFELTVTDNKGATATDVVKVTVNGAANKAPVANAGTDITITLPTNTISLKGSGTDSDGNIVSYLWAKKSGPPSFNIVNNKSAVTNVSGLVQGSYEFELTVTDDKGATATDVIKVTVNGAANKTPVANAGTDITITLPTNTVSLAGSGTDSDGKIVSYLWVKKSGPSSSNIVNNKSAVTDVSGLVKGSYEFELTVTDDKGATATDVVKVTVNGAANKAPVANAGSDITITLPTNTVSLAGSGTDSDGKIVSYLWAKKSGPSSFNIVNNKSAATNVTGLVQGGYEFELTVTDDKGATATDIVRVTVNDAANKAPVANAGSDVTITLPVNMVSLTGIGTDADGKIVSYQWTKTSGPAAFGFTTPTSASTTVTGLAEGVYVFHLKVTDDKGATGSDDVKVTVLAAGNAAPKAFGGGDVSITLPNNSVKLNGSGQDIDGTITAYHWTQISGPSSAKISTPDAASTAVEDLIGGNYSFELVVTDNKGATGRDIVLVTVSEPRLSAIEPTLTVFPNPVTSVTNLQIEGLESTGRVSIILREITGRTVLKKDFLSSGLKTYKETIDLSAYAQGTYIVTVQSFNGRALVSKKIIKTR